jgi:glycogen debranching enzyme
VVSSNPGQALWTGIVDEARAGAVVRHLLAPDMYSGWGIRTLSTGERRANPIGYHLGTVWPHDNAIIAAGMKRYGFDREALRVLDGIVEAARHFEHNRLPEVFAGFSREQFGAPVRYPVACHPQAWAAGSVPFLMTTLLGLSPNAFDHRLDVVRPVLPVGVDHLEFRRVRVGAGTVSLRFRRGRSDTVDVDVFEDEGVDVHVVRESPSLAH